MSNLVKLFGFIGGIAILVIVIVGFSFDKGNGGGGEKHLVDLLGTIVTNSANLDGNNSHLYRPLNQAGEAKWKVHVDLSSPMQGYLGHPQGRFKQLLSNLNSIAELVGVGEHTERSTEAPVPTDLLGFSKQGSYNRSVLDLGTVLSDINHNSGENQVHLLLTDGSSIREGQEVRRSEISSALRSATRFGGDIALLAIQIPYEGLIPVINPSRDPNQSNPFLNTASVSVMDRTLLIWVFAPKSGMMRSSGHPLGAVFEKLGARVVSNLAGRPADQPSFYVGKSPGYILISPCEPDQRLRFTNSEKYLFTWEESKRVAMKDTALVSETGEFEPITSGRVGGENRNVVFTFELPLGNSSGSFGIDLTAEDVADQLDVKLLYYNIPKNPEVITNLVGRAIQSPSIHSKVGASGNLVIELGNLRRPQRENGVPSTDILWMLTVKTKATDSLRALWSLLGTTGYSSEGRDPNSFSQVPGLATVLETIHRDYVVLGRVLLYSEWPGKS